MGLSGIAIGEVFPFRFYTGDEEGSYWEGMARKTGEIAEQETFVVVGTPVFKKGKKEVEEND